MVSLHRGADTNRNSNAAFQPCRFTSYERDGNGGDEAMFRRYSRAQARFDQPDPYEGSYNLSNPQSFNRYAYVRNDPVNFIDPTGLDEEDTFTCRPGDVQCQLGRDVTVKGGTASGAGGGAAGGLLPGSRHGAFDTDRGFADGPGGDGLDGVGGNSGAQDPPKQDVFRDCADFVNYLVALASQLKIPASSGTRHQTPAQQAASKLGLRMMAEAVQYDYMSSPVVGVKRELWKYGQNAGVYGHVLMQAGGFLESWGLGALESLGFRLSDHWQRHISPDPNRNAEALSEIAGNAAGRKVGGHMRNFIYGTTPREEQRLRNSLTFELCE